MVCGSYASLGFVAFIASILDAQEAGSFGLLGIGQLIDLFSIGNMVQQENMKAAFFRGAGNQNTVAPIINVSVNSNNTTSPEQVKEAAAETAK